MIKFSIAAFCMIAAAQMLQGAETSKLPPPSTKQGVTFEKDILPIFKENCITCHGDQRQRGGLRLDTLEASLKSVRGKKVILPTNSAESPLVASVARVNEREAMPPIPRSRPPSAEGSTNAGPKALTVEQVSLIRAWIDQGAK
jgi:mono/diheme cytochrome c family protein